VPSTDTVVITPQALLRHWQGHRRLTRRVIQAFPEAALFSYSIGGMRTFAELAAEMINLAEAGIQGLAKGDWGAERPSAGTQSDLLAIWDRTTETIDRFWPELPEDAFQRKYKAFGQWESTGQSHIFYWIDNEVHHRGQGYVYLRALGIEPPAFYDRG
jgi:uncharacterized damage-inducible protein DinB